jgi:hypothetical protein
MHQEFEPPRQPIDSHEDRRNEKLRQRALEATARVVPLGRSYFEAAALRPSTHRDYERRAQKFIGWACIADLNWASFPELDHALREYFDHRFFSGGAAAQRAMLRRPLPGSPSSTSGSTRPLP